MSSNKNLLFTGVMAIAPFLFFSQSPKKLCDAGEKLEKMNNINEAIDNYSKAIQLDINFAKAYSLRAGAYEKAGKKAEAINDYVAVTNLNVKEKMFPYKAAKLMADLERYEEADKMFRKVFTYDRAFKEAIEAEVKVLIKLRDFDYGITVTQMGMDAKRSATSIFNHAVIHDSLNHPAEAEKYYKLAVAEDSKFIPGYVGLASALVKLGKYEEAYADCQSILSKEPSNLEALFIKSQVFAYKKDMQNAVNEITKVVLVSGTPRALKQRASYYETMGQSQNAISDYSQILRANENDIDAYMRRAVSNEHIQNIKLAIEDYHKVVSLSPGKDGFAQMSANAKNKIFELSKEGEKPEVAITSLKSENNTIKVPADKKEYSISGLIKDASYIKSLSVNAGNVTYSPDSMNPKFTIAFADISAITELRITATDSYSNTQVGTFKVERTESDKPEIAIEAPYTSPDFEIALDVNGTDLYMQGKVKDASFIESITIDGVNASFNPSALNPDFTANVKIADKDKITFSVKDIYGNINNQVFSLNRAGLTAGVDNPMGTTWVVFIENSKYLNFPSLEGPAKDVLAMKTALANYKITKTISKQNMTKTEMDKFFSIELRDYVKNNNVNSLVIWYAGHGKYVSPTGYWVPSDGKLDDEFSYYGINNLKAHMQSYAGKLLHTLVITDACESGATFLMAMRGGDDDKKCSSWELTKAKSSQVFTSAGFELASDNSQFTKTFVSTLNNNVEPCLAIEKIVKKVTASVTKAGNQAPKFGKIKDLEDEGGTFFFVKK